jgi:quinol monooxygenase YgiN
MVIRIGLFGPLSPEEATASRRNLLERFLPALKSQSGFVAGYWGESPDGRWISISVWENEQAMEQGAAHANTTPLLPEQNRTQIVSPQTVELFAVWAAAFGTSAIHASPPT